VVLHITLLRCLARSIRLPIYIYRLVGAGPALAYDHCTGRGRAVGVHLTGEETATLVAAVVALIGAAAAWLKSHSAQQRAGRAETKANKALNGTAGQAGNGQSGSGTPRASA
jgi:hypothetical protein